MSKNIISVDKAVIQEVPELTFMQFSFYIDGKSNLILSEILDPTNDSLYMVQNLLIELLNFNFIDLNNQISKEDLFSQDDINMLNFCENKLSYPLNQALYLELFKISKALTNENIQTKLEYFSTISTGINTLKSKFEIITNPNTSQNEVFLFPNVFTYTPMFFMGEIHETYSFTGILDIFSFCFIQAFKHKIIINKCQNCGKYFLPKTRKDEIYCDNVFKGNKSCKNLGYSVKVDDDKYLKAYRVAYKNKNAYKLRNSKNIPNIQERLDKWVDEAKVRMETAKNGQISFDEYQSWLKLKL